MKDPLNTLPKKLNKREANLTPKVLEKLEKRHPHPNWAVEIKLIDGKLAKHQEKALKQVENGKFTYKIPDQGARNPFDAIHLGDADALVAWVDPVKKTVKVVVNNGVYEYTFRL